MLVDLKEVWKAVSAREFCKTPFSNGGRVVWGSVASGECWLARTRREGVRRAGLLYKIGELPYGLGSGKRGGRLLWKATCG